MRLVQQPTLQWVNSTKNVPVAQGFMYFGVVGQDPKIPANQITVFRKNQLNEYVEVQQPINLSDSGVPIYLGQEMTLYVEEDCAIRVDDRNGAEQYLIRQYFGAQDDTLRDDISALSGIKALKQVEGVAQTTLGYNTDSGVGGGQFRWNPSRPQSDHNACTVFCADAITAWDGTKADFATLRDIVGVGSGCFERILLAGTAKPEISPLMCGATADGTDDYAQFLHALQLAFSISSGYGSAVFDGLGCTYVISQQVNVPTGRNVTMKNFNLDASISFPAPDYLLSYGSDGLMEVFANEDISLENVIINNNHRGGGIKATKFNRFTMKAVRFLRVSTKGLYTYNPADTHELQASDLYFCEYLWEDDDRSTGTRTSTAMEIDTNDNFFTQVTVASASIGLKLMRPYNLFDQLHLWGCTTWGGWLTANAAHNSIEQIYVDSCSLLIENPWHTSISGKFLHASSDPTFAFFVLKPMSAGVGVSGFKVTGSEFINNVATEILPFKTDTSAGTFASASISQCQIHGNSFSNVKRMGTKLYKALYQTGTEWNIDFTGHIPFGAIQRVDHTFKADSAGYFNHWVSDINSFDATVSTSVSTAAVVTMEVDVNRLVSVQA